MTKDFNKFLLKFRESFKNKDSSINSTIANVFSMRVIGNKTHGDLAEIALTEYINEFVPGYKATHTGKLKFRAKSKEEDILVEEISSKIETPISIKTYGFGPLQLSTNKTSSMFSHLTKEIGEGTLKDKIKIEAILKDASFAEFEEINILPLIYNEKKLSYKILNFDVEKAFSSVNVIQFVSPRKIGSKSTFPIYKFFDINGKYIFEIRYGGVSANALQRGMWTHTEHASDYFIELLSGSYKINFPLIELFSKLLNRAEKVHEKILKEL